MSPPRAALLAALLALAAAAPACGDDPKASQARSQTAEAWQALADYGADRRDDFVRELEALIASLDVQLDNLRVRSARATGDAKAKIETALEDLQRQRGDITRRLSELEQTSADAWRSARDGALEAFRSLRDGIDQAVREE